MDVLYSSSDSYAFLTGISMLSLLENNRNMNNIHFFVMDNNISKENKEKLSQVAELYKRKITFVPMPDMKELTGLDIDTRRWNISTFGRLYMASTLPGTVHKVLNIDCDTIIVDQLDRLWDIDISDVVCGGMLECMNDRYRRNNGMKNESSYINGGIVYFNLDAVRKDEYEQKFTNYIVKYGNSLAYLDQDVINGVIPQDKIKILPIRFNMISLYFYTTYEQVEHIRRSKTFYSKEEFDEGKRNPAIVHFTSCFLDCLRPWIKGNRHPWLNEFLKYKSLSPWKDVPLWDVDGGWITRWKLKLIRHLPKRIIYEAASIMHGIIVPERNHIHMILTCHKK